MPLPEVLPEPEGPPRQLCGVGDSGSGCPGDPFLPPKTRQPMVTVKNGSLCPGRGEDGGAGQPGLYMKSEKEKIIFTPKTPLSNTPPAAAASHRAL